MVRPCLPHRLRSRHSETHAASATAGGAVRPADYLAAGFQPCARDAERGPRDVARSTRVTAATHAKSQVRADGATFLDRQSEQQRLVDLGELAPGRPLHRMQVRIHLGGRLHRRRAEARYARHAFVAMVNPGGTGSPNRVISARLAPMPRSPSLKS